MKPNILFKAGKVSHHCQLLCIGCRICHYCNWSFMSDRMRGTRGLRLSGRAGWEFVFQEAELLPDPFPITSETIKDSSFCLLVSDVQHVYLVNLQSTLSSVNWRVSLFSCKCQTCSRKLKWDILSDLWEWVVKPPLTAKSEKVVRMCKNIDFHSLANHMNPIYFMFFSPSTSFHLLMSIQGRNTLRLRCSDILKSQFQLIFCALKRSRNCSTTFSQ